MVFVTTTTKNEKLDPGIHEWIFYCLTARRCMPVVCMFRLVSVQKNYLVSQTQYFVPAFILYVLYNTKRN